MNAANRTFAGIAVVLILIALCPVATAQVDCNGVNGLDTDDVVYLISYFFNDGPPPPDMAACDCDGYAGVNFAEIPHIVGVVFQGCSEYPSPGTDMLMPSDVRFWVIGRPDAATVFSAEIFVKTPFEIEAAAIPFSYAAEPGEAELTCTSVDFTGSVANMNCTIFDGDKEFVIHGPGPTAIPAGAEGLVCTAHFGLAGAAGDPVTILPTSTERISPILVRQGCYDGDNRERVYYPQFMAPPIGDCNCDRLVDIDDVVWIIDYIFNNGPEPYDCY